MGVTFRQCELSEGAVYLLPALFYKKRYVEVMAVNMELVHIGFGNILVMNRVIAMAAPNSAPTKRTILEAKNKGQLVDLTNGRRTKVVIFTDSGHIILAALAPETIAGRHQATRVGSVFKLEQSGDRDEP
jgi:regulator of extracellular matrix RemA (YlzA/DUF370 family)